MLKSLKKNILLYYRYSFAKVKTYYPGKRKPPLRVFIDLLKYHISQGEFFHMYYMFGAGLDKANRSKYLGKKSIFELKNKIDRAIKSYYGITQNYDVVTKDKFIAGSILKSNGFPCLVDLALVKDSRLINGADVSNLDAIFDLGNELVLKNILLEASEGVIFIRRDGEQIYLNNSKVAIEALKNHVKGSIWVVQIRMSAHSEIRKINNSALNVTRLVTVLSGKEVKFLGGFQAFATGEALTDSWDKGSVYVGIESDGYKLSKFGFHSPWYKGVGLIESHPDSQISFSGLKLPHLQEAIELCRKAHELFYTNFLLGWDVALTDNGPVIVEVNEKPGMNVLQCLSQNIADDLVNHAGKCMEVYDK